MFRAGVFDADDLRRAHTRIAHEIVERNHGADDVVLVGLYTRGVALARRLAAAIEEFEDVDVPVGALDVAFYRDDIGLRPVQPLGPTEVPVDIAGKVVVLVDDVLFTGRTVARRARRAHRARPAAGGAARGARRPRPPRAADPRRLRRQEPADPHGEDVRVRLAEVDGGDDGVELWGEPVEHELEEERREAPARRSPTSTAPRLERAARPLGARSSK